MTHAVLTGLIGRHIGASRSPWLHEQEAAAQGLSLRYTLFDFAVTGQDATHLDAQLKAAQSQGYAGLNITHPYKQSVIAYLDELSPGAGRVGAVNTVQFSGGRRVGHNTDVTGFAESMRTGLPGAKLRRILQLGAGGAGAATAQALLELGATELLINDREPGRARVLVDKLRTQFAADRTVVCDSPTEVLTTVDGVVNATPMGMADSQGSPINTTILAASQWVADVVYFPLDTAMLIGARRQGCRTLDGSGMAVFQAAAAFDIFTGLTADRVRMLKSFCAAPT
jgi:shikimate dehydrogenase